MPLILTYLSFTLDPKWTELALNQLQECYYSYIFVSAKYRSERYFRSFRLILHVLYSHHTYRSNKGSFKRLSGMSLLVTRSQKLRISHQYRQYSIIILHVTPFPHSPPKLLREALKWYQDFHDFSTLEIYALNTNIGRCRIFLHLTLPTHISMGA